jgi:methionine-gamma-lyase
MTGTNRSDARSRNAAEVGFATPAIHHDDHPTGFANAGQPPVFLTSTYGFDKVAANEAAAALGGRLHARQYDTTTDVLRPSCPALVQKPGALPWSS